MPRDAEQELLDFVRAHVVPKRRRVAADTPLFERRLVDSMNILKLVGYVERELGRQLRTRELVMSNFRTVRTIARTFLDDAR